MRFLFLFLFALVPLIHALFDDDPELDPELSLYSAVRNAATVDIRGIYLLQEATGQAADQCPKNITHTTWRRISDGTIGLPHNTIIQDGDRCESSGDERSLRFFMGTRYDEDFNPIGDAAPLPEDFIRVMQISGFNVNARAGIAAAGGKYLMGYEEAIRVCGGMSKFGIGTTAFLMRPTDNDIVINNIATTLKAGLKYLLMVPRFRKTFCLYTSDVNGPDDAFRPLPTEDPSESEEPSETDEVDVSPLPKPIRSPVVVPRPPRGVDTAIPTEEEDMEPSMTPEDLLLTPAGDVDEGVCFPGDATVSLQDGRHKRMDEIRMGDKVQVGDGEFSTVFAFTHKDASVTREFIRLATGRAAITATVGHFIYINKQAQRIETAQVGDTVTLSNGEQAIITKISKVMKNGLYNPQTHHGDIMVDGVKATTYTKTVDPRLAHAVLAPVRAMFNVLGVDMLSERVGDMRAVWLRS